MSQKKKVVKKTKALLVNLNSEAFVKRVLQIIVEAASKPNQMLASVAKLRFELRPDGWVRDYSVKIGQGFLERGPDYPVDMSWENAMKHAESQGYRLETVEEADSLIDRSKTPTIVEGYPGKIQTSGWYWTKTKVPGYAGYAYVVEFEYGRVNYCGRQDNHFHVRPVRVSQ